MTDLYELGLETKTLYRCRGCAVITESKIGPCPACGYDEGPTVERGQFDGTKREVELPWYETMQVVAES